MANQRQQIMWLRDRSVKSRQQQSSRSLQCPAQEVLQRVQGKQLFEIEASVTLLLVQGVETTLHQGMTLQ